MQSSYWKRRGEKEQERKRIIELMEKEILLKEEGDKLLKKLDTKKTNKTKSGSEE